MKITKNDVFGGAILNCAVRYSLGRMSYMPGLVMDEIKNMLCDCPIKTLKIFEKDIKEWLDNRNSDGLYAYEKEWSIFLVAVMTEIENRKGD